jgi:hypothetical protein
MIYPDEQFSEEEAVHEEENLVSPHHLEAEKKWTL